jgi:uncharacterized membrane protein
MADSENKTSLGLSENVEALLCYLLIWVTGIIFLILEKENKNIKFHAMQSLVTFLPLNIAFYIIALIPIIGPVISVLIAILMVILWVILMYKAFNREMYKLPIAGDIAEKQVQGR